MPGSVVGGTLVPGEPGAPVAGGEVSGPAPVAGPGCTEVAGGAVPVPDGGAATSAQSSALGRV